MYFIYRDREKKVEILMKLSAILDDKCEEDQVQKVNEPVRVKTNNLGLQPGLTQTSLYNLSSRLEP